MPNIIKPKRKYTTGAPIASQLAQGELAINLFDKKIYSKDLLNNIVLLSSLNGSSTEKYKVANAVDNDEAVNKGQLDMASPTGLIILYPAATAPSGFLECNGATLSRVTFANLWTFAQNSGALVTNAAWSSGKQGCFATGDGSTTFKIPDLRGEFIRGWDHTRGVDSGRTIGSWQEDLFKSHSHSWGINVFSAYTTGAGAPGFGNIFGSTSTTGGVETRPRNIAMMYCIKY